MDLNRCALETQTHARTGTANVALPGPAAERVTPVLMVIVCVDPVLLVRGLKCVSMAFARICVKMLFAFLTLINVRKEYANAVRTMLARN